KITLSKTIDLNTRNYTFLIMSFYLCNKLMFIPSPQIRNAWSDKKSVARNLRDMGLAFDPNRALPIKTPAVNATAPKLVRKPYVLNELVAEASLPEKDTKTLSTDLIEYVQYMVREHSENYKAMARDEKNYYQDTPSQIRRKVDQYKRCHPEEYTTFMESLKGGKAVST
uniref:Nucleolar protein 16 n=1 Tax=Oncorhynchus mykiss TaxID=8022 RepID=A0A8C7SJ90_ONCMY